MMTDIEAFIVRHIADRHGIESTGIERDADLFDRGYVDSLGVFNMMMVLEENFGIRFSEYDMVDPRINTVSGLAAIIDDKQRD